MPSAKGSISKEINSWLNAVRMSESLAFVLGIFASMLVGMFTGISLASLAQSFSLWSFPHTGHAALTFTILAAIKTMAIYGCFYGGLFGCIGQLIAGACLPPRSSIEKAAVVGASGSFLVALGLQAEFATVVAGFSLAHLLGLFSLPFDATALAFPCVCGIFGGVSAGLRWWSRRGIQSV